MNQAPPLVSLLLVLSFVAVDTALPNLDIPSNPQPTLRKRNHKPLPDSCSLDTAVLHGEGELCDFEHRIFCQFGFICTNETYQFGQGQSQYGTCTRFILFQYCNSDKDCGSLSFRCTHGYCLPPDPKFFSFPPDFPCQEFTLLHNPFSPVDSNAQCISNRCQNGFCAVQHGHKCDDYNGCSFDSYCKNGCCAPKVDQNGLCNEGNQSWEEYNDVECEHGLTCDFSVTPKRCIPFFSKVDGESCLQQKECSSGFCDCRDNKCKSLSQLNDTTGQYCEESWDCGPGFICTCNSTCQFNAAPSRTFCSVEYQEYQQCSTEVGPHLEFIKNECCLQCTNDTEQCEKKKIELNTLLLQTCLLPRLPCSKQIFNLLFCERELPYSHPSPCESEDVATSYSNKVMTQHQEERKISSSTLLSAFPLTWLIKLIAALIIHSYLYAM